jgi:putative membrane-bound dehydrogenase-like protein
MLEGLFSGGRKFWPDWKRTANLLVMNIPPITRLCAWFVVSSAGCSILAQQGQGWQFDREGNRDALPDVPEGFEVAFFAREPMVRNPCSIAFDGSGRMFVSHGPQYRKPTPDTPPDSVVLLEDSDGDGAADAVRTFATGFNCVQGLAWHGNDLWVANAPDLTVVRDTDGDDVADEYIRVFTDLGNIEHGLHGLNWAPDGRLYMSKGNSKGLVIREWKQDEPDRLAPAPFRELWGVPGPEGAPDFPAPKTFTAGTYKAAYHDPEDDWGRMGGILRCEDMGRNLEIVARGLRNPYGLGFDDGFDWLGVDQDQNEGDRVFMPFYSAEYGWSHAWSPHWTGEGHLPTVPISGPVFHGSGTGVLFADAPNWPEEFRGVWLVNDWLHKKTHVYRPAWEGALMQPQGGRWEDFIAGGKSLFRPVDMAFGPDGALYVIGWGGGYGVERDQDGAMTNEGRVFRVMPKEGRKLPALAGKELPDMKTAELIAEFASVLPVRRINAQNELVRRGAAVVGDIVAALESTGLPAAGETWAVWTLARIGGNERFLKRIAMDAGATLNRRLQAVRALGFVKCAFLPEMLPSLLASPEPRLRLAAIQAAHQAGMTACLSTLTDHAASESDRVCYYATWRALRDLGGRKALEPLLADERGPVRAAALLGLLDLGAMNPDTLNAMADDADKTVATVAQLGLGRGVMKPLGEAFKGGAANAASDGAAASDRLSPIASNIGAESRRGYATGTLQVDHPSYTDRNYVFTRVPEMLAETEIIRTSNEDDGSRGNSFLTFELALASTVFVAHDVRVEQRPEWLQAFADSDLSVTTTDTQFHLWSKDFPAGKVTLGGNLPAGKSGPKANYFVVIQPKPLPPQSVPSTAAPSLAALEGADARRGEALFFHSAACATCHRVGNRGTNFGPDLTNLGDRMEVKYVVQSILDPNAVITEGFSAHSIEAEGQSHLGVLLSTGRTVRLGVAGGRIVEIPEEKITKHETLPVSPMPPMGSLLSPQDVADVTAWLMTAGHRAAGDASPAAAEAPVSARPATAQPSAPEPAFIFRPADISPLSVVEKPDRLVISQSGAMIGEFVFAHPEIRRPFFANLRAPGGIPVTRAWPPVEGVDATDHADMHPGVWLAFGDVGGQDFWRNKAAMKHEGFAAPPEWKGDHLGFATVSSLLASDGTRMARMRCDFTLAPKGHELHLGWAAAVTPEIDGFYFGDQEEMGFGVRMATPLIEKNGGLVTSSTGRTTARETWGQPAEWCEYSRTANGIRVGARVIPDPANLRPSWWHNRDYGVFVANPFGRKAMKQGEESRVEVKKGGTYRLGFTVVLYVAKE